MNALFSVDGHRNEALTTSSDSEATSLIYDDQDLTSVNVIFNAMTHLQSF